MVDSALQQEAFFSGSGTETIRSLVYWAVLVLGHLPNYPLRNAFSNTECTMLLTSPWCCSCCSSEDSASADAKAAKPAKPAKPEKPVEPAWSDEDTGVVHLTGSTFQEFIQTHSSALVMFYAPCKFLLGLACQANGLYGIAVLSRSPPSSCHVRATSTVYKFFYNWRNETIDKEHKQFPWP